MLTLTTQQQIDCTIYAIKLFKKNRILLKKGLWPYGEGLCAIYRQSFIYLRYEHMDGIYRYIPLFIQSNAAKYANGIFNILFWWPTVTSYEGYDYIHRLKFLNWILKELKKEL